MTATAAQSTYNNILHALPEHGKPVKEWATEAYSECARHTEPAILYVRIKNDQVGMNCRKGCAPGKVMATLGINGYAKSRNGQQDRGSRQLLSRDLPLPALTSNGSFR